MRYPSLPREQLNQSPRLRRKITHSSWYEIQDVTREGGIASHDVARMVHGAKQGGVALVASDTGYSFLADPFNSRARRFIDAIRGDQEAMYPVVFGSLAMLLDYADVGASASGVLRRLTPGPVTPILDIRPDLPERNRIAEALRTDGTVAARLPDGTLETSLSNELRRPVTTAALRYDDGVIVTDYEDARLLLAARLETVEDVPPLTVVRGVVRYHEHSTMVRIETQPFAESKVTIVREGAVDVAQIREASRDVWFDIDTT
jgi:tRNA A37 threonylcarbamoyladenosine synthetase subunit TsaC/SUA5/YrdC